ncbi:MAG: hypothetical protein RUMPE_01197 [Eubacteriales bacterium SKADARSKE-1]|nr:hypothetical protein [Eubacteriales bacterium SKADARSKE-1]MDQ5984161.1 hypothetical protein [Eubacteriales bacterium SKADARSKE-1]
MCLIDNEGTPADHSSTTHENKKTLSEENVSAVKKALENATFKAWGGISSTASKGWKAMWAFNDAVAEYTYVGPVKATAWGLGGLVTLLGCFTPYLKIFFS